MLLTLFQYCDLDLVRGIHLPKCVAVILVLVTTDRLVVCKHLAVTAGFIQQISIFRQSMLSRVGCMMGTRGVPVQQLVTGEVPDEGTERRASISLAACRKKKICKFIYTVQTLRSGYTDSTLHSQCNVHDRRISLRCYVLYY